MEGEKIVPSEEKDSQGKTGYNRNRKYTESENRRVLL